MFERRGNVNTNHLLRQSLPKCRDVSSLSQLPLNAMARPLSESPRKTLDVSGQSSDELLSEWRWMVAASLELRMVSSLGDAFLESPDGAGFWLDVAAAELALIAHSKEEFDQLRQLPENVEQWFMPQLVGDLLSGVPDWVLASASATRFRPHSAVHSSRQTLRSLSCRCTSRRLARFKRK